MYVSCPGASVFRNNRMVFGKVYIEIRYMLETNLLRRFMETVEFKERENRAPPPLVHRRRMASSGSMIFDIEGSPDSNKSNTRPPLLKELTLAVVY